MPLPSPLTAAFPSCVWEVVVVSAAPAVVADLLRAMGASVVEVLVVVLFVSSGRRGSWASPPANKTFEVVGESGLVRAGERSFPRRWTGVLGVAGEVGVGYEVARVRVEGRLLLL